MSKEYYQQISCLVYDHIKQAIVIEYGRKHTMKAFL